MPLSLIIKTKVCTLLSVPYLYNSGSQCGLYCLVGNGGNTYVGDKMQGGSRGRWRLFTFEVTLDQTLGNLYHFIKPIHRFKNLLTVKQLLNAVTYFVIEIGWDGVDWIELAQGRNQWRALVNTVMNLRVP
jgi:hypothetical protein